MKHKFKPRYRKGVPPRHYCSVCGEKKEETLKLLEAISIKDYHYVGTAPSLALDASKIKI